MKNSIYKKRIILYLWISFSFLMLWLISDLISNTDTFVPRAFNNIWRVLYVTFLNFVLFEYALPFIRRKRKWVVYNILIGILLLWVIMMLYSFGAYLWRLIGIGLHIYTPLITYTNTGKAVENSFAYSVSSICFFGVTSHIYDHIKLVQAAQQLLIQKQVAELSYLRSQTNPHFLFNTLNNIYSLSRDKSDLAPESILRLSKILRFMLYETSGSFIAIEQELKIINDYISLEKLRYDESLRVNFNYNIEDLKQAIPPLLLIPLVENAFKHGVSETRSNPFVDIHLSVNKRILTLTIKNSTESLPDQAVKENIGISNLRRQLELLYKEYDLSLQPGKMEFIATLKINLGSHV
ncbi:MAG: sensor histidine kinase [Flavisolibacter sp.]